MPLQTEMRANIVAWVDKASFNDGINYARDTWKKIDQALKTKLELDVAWFQLKLDDARRALKDAKKSGDQDLKFQAQLNVNNLTSSLTYAKWQLWNLVATWDKDTSRLQLKFNMLAEEARKMWQEINRVWLSWSQIASLEVKIAKLDDSFKKGTISAQQYAEWMKKIKNETANLQSASSGLSSISNILIGAWLATGVQKLADGVITLAWNLQQARIAFGVMLWSAGDAEVLLKDLADFAKKTPFELVGLREQATKLLAYGFTAKEIIPILETLGNISAWVWVDKLPRLTYALGQVRAAGKLTWQDFRQFTEAGVWLGEELEKMTWIASIHSWNVSDIGITYEQVQQALQNLWSEWWKFGGLMEAQAKTLQGTRSNLKDNINILWEQIGTIFIPILTWLTKVLVSITWYFSNLAKEAPILTAVIAWIAWALWLFVAWLWAYVAIAPIATAMTTALWLSTITLWTALTYVLWPIGLVVAWLFLLTKAYNSNLLWFRDFVDWFVSGAKVAFEFAKLVFWWITDTLNQFVSNLKFVTGIIEKLLSAIWVSFSWLSWIKNVVSNVFWFIGSFVKQQVFGIYTAIGQLLSLLAKIPWISSLIKQAKINATDQSQFWPKAYDPTWWLLQSNSGSTIASPWLNAPKWWWSSKAIDNVKKEIDAQVKLINDDADARILALSRTKKSREKNAQEIIDIDRKREEAIKEITWKSADIQIDTAKKVVEEAKKNFETTKSSAEKAFDEVSKAVDKSADSVKKLNDDLKSVNDSLAEIDQTIWSRVVAIEQQLADTNLSYEQRRKLEEELALAKWSITEEELAKAREEEAKSETQKLLDKRTALEEKKKQLEEELAFEKTISDNLALAKIDLEKKIADAHEAELKRQENATIKYTTSVIEMYKQIEIAAKKASEAWSAIFGGGTIPWRAVWWPVSAWSPYIVGEKWPEMFVPHNSGTIIPNNVLNNNINVNANVANGIDMDVLANTLAHKIALTRKWVF